MTHPREIWEEIDSEGEPETPVSRLRICPECLAQVAIIFTPARFVPHEFPPGTHCPGGGTLWAGRDETPLPPGSMNTPHDGNEDPDDEAGIWARQTDDKSTPIETWIAGAPGVPRQMGRSEEQARWKVRQLIGKLPGFQTAKDGAERHREQLSKLPLSVWKGEE